MPALGASWEHRGSSGGDWRPVGFGLLPEGKGVCWWTTAVADATELTEVTLSYLLYASYLLYLLYAYDTNKTS